MGKKDPATNQRKEVKPPTQLTFEEKDASWTTEFENKKR